MTGKKTILRYLADNNAVLTGSHFIYTSGMHGTAYINMRAVAHHTDWLSDVGESLAAAVNHYVPDVVIGPETLGRTLATFTAERLPCGTAIWCDMSGEGEDKSATFSPKLDFGRLVTGRRVVIVDDLLTTGSSIKLVADLVTGSGGDVVAAAAVVRRTPDVTANVCGVPALEVLADVEGFKVYSEEQCAQNGPCSEHPRRPVVLRPGHGWKWIENHPDYPTV